MQGVDEASEVLTPSEGLANALCIINTHSDAHKHKEVHTVAVKRPMQ